MAGSTSAFLSAQRPPKACSNGGRRHLHRRYLDYRNARTVLVTDGNVTIGRTSPAAEPARAPAAADGAGAGGSNHRPGPSGRVAAADGGLLACCGPPAPRDMSSSEVAAELRKVRIEPGLWQLDSRMIDASGPNLPRQARAKMLTRGRSTRNCITPERAAHPEGSFLQMHRGSRCTFRDYSTEGGRVTGWMRCTGGGLPGVITTSMEGRTARPNTPLPCAWNRPACPQAPT
jgi:hypothetical protein